MGASESMRGGAPGGAGPRQGSKPSLRAAMVVFQYRHYRYLWTSSALSFTGMQIQQVARALLAWELTKSYGAVGAVSLSFGLPMMLFSLIGGSLADRLEKRNLTLMTQTGVGILSLITAVLITTDVITIQILLGLGLVQGTFFALGMPARTPLMAEVVGPRNVMSAIAMSNAAMNATRLLGPAIAGVLVALWGIDSAYYVMSAFYALAIITMLRVPTGLSQLAREESGSFRRPQGNMFVEIGRGLSYVARHPRLRLLIGMLFILTFFASPYIILLPGFVQDDLGRSKSAFALLQMVSGVGALVGALGIATLTGHDRKPLIQWVAGILAGVGLILLAIGSSIFGFGGALVAVLFLGFFLTAYQTLNNTMLMDEADPEYYGRVMSINMLTFSAMPVMAYPLGAIADAYGAKQTFFVEGAIVAGFMVVVALINTRYTFGRLAPRLKQVSVTHGGSDPANTGPGVTGAGTAAPGP
ncbi:MAG: MFS transporter [Dehalococcoidia bacterium]